MVTLSRRSFLGASSVALGGLALSHGGPVARATPADPPVLPDGGGVIPPTSAVPGSDGTLPGDEWDGALSLTDIVTFYRGDPIDSVAVDLLAGGAHLHLRVRIDEPVGRRPAKVEALVRSPMSRDTFRLAIPVRTVSPSVVGSWGGTVRSFTSITPVVGETDSGWTAETAIRYNSFGGATGESAEEWRINVVGLYEPGREPAWSSFPIRAARILDKGNDTTVSVIAPVADEDRYASLHLRELPEGHGVPWHDPRPQLVELAHGQSVIRLSAIGAVTAARAEWRTPGGEWELLGPPDVSAGHDTVTVAITHPPMVRSGVHLARLGLTTEEGDHTATVPFDRETLLRGISDHSMEGPPDRDPVSSGPSPESEALVALVPDRVGMYFCGLPESPGLRPERIFTFDAGTPQVLHAEASALAYPHPDYPEDQEFVVEAADGNLSYPYHEDADGRRYFFSAHLWHHQREHVLAALPDLAQSDPAGAALVLYELGRAYQSWQPTCDYLWQNYPVSLASGPPYISYGGMWARWSKSELWDFRFVLPAFDAVRRTTAFDELSDRVGTDVERFLIEKMIMPSVEFADTFPTDHYNYGNWLGFALAGRSVQDGDLVHRAIELITEFYNSDYLFDGFHTVQTVSYHVQLTEGAALAVDATSGWSDPVGARSVRTGQHHDDLDLRSQIPVIGMASEIPRRLVYPNGRVLPIQDSWPSDRPAEPVTDSGSWLLPASGIVRLARQRKDVDEATAYLEFHPKYRSHVHRDPLNLVLFDHGQELLPDIGYSHTRYRMWTRSQLAHNTVVVDSTDMALPDSEHPGGSLATMAVGEGFQVAAASMEAYDQATTYAREVLALDVPGETRGYYVDIFRVTGGERHEYTFNGDANAEATARTDVNVEHYGDHLLPDGVTVTPPQDETDTGDAEGHYYGYLYVRDVSRGEPGEGIATVRIDSEESFPGEASGASLHTHLVTEDGDELFLGRAQSLRATRLEGRPSDTNDVADLSPGVPRHTMPKVVLRRQRGSRRRPERGERPEVPELVSRFRTVFEAVPAGGEALVESVEAVPVSAGPDDALALVVRFSSGISHTVLSNPSGAVLRAGDCTLEGRYGIVEHDVDGVSRLWLVDGTRLSCGTATLTSDHWASSTLVATQRRAEGDDRNALVVSGQVEPWVVGRYAIVTHPDGATHGYLVTDLGNDGANTVLDLGGGEPGLVRHDDGEFGLSSFPFTRWEGEHTVTIGGVEEWSRS